MTCTEPPWLLSRWAAESEGELVAAAEHALQRGIRWDEDEDLIWEIREPVALFDAAWPQNEIEPDNHLVVDPDPGHYRVRATHLANAENWMILVQVPPLVIRSEK